MLATVSHSHKVLCWQQCHTAIKSLDMLATMSHSQKVFRYAGNSVVRLVKQKSLDLRIENCQEIFKNCVWQRVSVGRWSGQLSINVNFIHNHVMTACTATEVLWTVNALCTHQTKVYIQHTPYLPQQYMKITITYSLIFAGLHITMCKDAIST